MLSHLTAAQTLHNARKLTLEFFLSFVTLICDTCRGGVFWDVFLVFLHTLSLATVAIPMQTQKCSSNSD